MVAQVQGETGVTGAILIVIGVVALFAAIVGGGIKVRDIEVGSVPSKWRQGLLALFGVFIAFVGLLMWVDDDDSAADSNKAAAVSNIAADEAPGDSNAVAEPNAVADANAAEIPAEDPNQAAPTEENAAQ
jgi:hypothetical protein